MTPEERINRELWYVLGQLKEGVLRTKSGYPIEHWVDFAAVISGAPTPKNEVMALEKLEELGVIKILNPGGDWDYI